MNVINYMEWISTMQTKFNVHINICHTKVAKKEISSRT